MYRNDYWLNDYRRSHIPGRSLSEEYSTSDQVNNNAARSKCLQACQHNYSISISTLKPKREAEAPKINQQDSYLQFWAPNKPKYVGPLSPDGKSDRTKPRGSIDSSSTGLSEYNRRALEKPFETMVILFKHHRPLVFTCKLSTIN
jgi:hypothetical protein